MLPLTSDVPASPDYYFFDKAKKRIFLDQFAKTPNITGVANAIGHSRQVIFWHLERDPEFKKEFEEIREGITDGLEAKVAEYGQRPQNFMDRIAWLRARRPDVWAPQPMMNVNVNVNQAERLATDARSFIDTTATPTTDGRTHPPSEKSP